MNWTSNSAMQPNVWGNPAGIQYVYSANQNNGQITQAQYTPGGTNVSYQYDGLKRLISAVSAPGGGGAATWTETMQYDGFGNLTAKVLNGATTSIPVNAATNRLANAYYDGNGNMTSGAGATLVYDVANRIVSATEVSGGTEYYQYAPDGKRIFRLAADGMTNEWTFWGARGEKLGTFAMNYDPYADYKPVLSPTLSFGGKTIWDGGKVLVQDRLGTNVGAGGFYPYGDEIISTANDRTKFATYRRDGFTGLDYADQRYYASVYGRFNSPDPYKASGLTKDPASWNRYSYTRNDPVNRFDRAGTCDTDATIFDFDTGSGDEGGCDDGSGSNGGGGNGTVAETCAAVGLAFDSTTNECLEPSDAGSSTAAPPECFAQLKDRPVNDPTASLFNAYHSFWWIQDATGAQDIVSAGPQRGFLDVWLIPGANNGADNSGDTTVWSSGLSGSVCAQVSALELAAQKFPNNRIRYSPWPGPNSNTAAHYLAVAGSFYFSVPYNLYGWNAPLPVAAPPHPGPGKGGPRQCPPGRVCPL